MATERAKSMAMKQVCEHSNPNDIVKLLGSTPWRRIGENVSCGKSLGDVYNEMINNPEHSDVRNNITDRRFTAFGIGTATSSKGGVYVCQIYKG